jgi:SAM-dependent methyltransferase
MVENGGLIHRRTITCTTGNTIATTASFQHQLQIRRHAERTFVVLGCGAFNDSILMKRDILSPGRIYIESLEEVLAMRLDSDTLKGKVVRKQLEAIAADVLKLSRGLTGRSEVELEKGYLSRKEFQLAYRLYYTTTNFLKIIPPLRELAFLQFAEKESLRVLDLGSGTGAAIWGLVQFLEAHHRQTIELAVVAVDSVSENLAFIRMFATAVAKRCTHVKLRVETKQQDLEALTDKSFPAGSFDLVTMMNTLNELSDSAQVRLFGSLPSYLSESGSMLVIEPASREASRSLLRHRDRMVDQGLTVYAPCTRQASCPALSKEDDWCHSEYRWERPRVIALIDEMSGLVRLSLKSTYLTLNRSGLTLRGSLPVTLESDGYRVVSERFDEKGRVRAICCGESGRDGFVLNKRDKSLANKAFTDVERYDLVQISNATKREHDTVISEASTVQLVLQSSGAR